jgi:hypothetical protein
MIRHDAPTTRASPVTTTSSSIAVAGRKCGCHARPNTIPASRPRNPKHVAQAATTRPGSESMRRMARSPVNSTQRGVDCKPRAYRATLPVALQERPTHLLRSSRIRATAQGSVLGMGTKTIRQALKGWEKENVNLSTTCGESDAHLGSNTMSSHFRPGLCSIWGTSGRCPGLTCDWPFGPKSRMLNPTLAFVG